MSELEDPVTTVVRLLSKNMRVAKDDGATASIYVSREWYDRELFKNYDGQVTVGLAESRDTKIEMSGRIRRRLGSLRVNVWATDRPAQVDTGRVTRNKMVEEVNRIVRENRTIPNQTCYDFVGVGPLTGTHKAYYAKTTNCLLPPTAPDWTELAAADYEKLWYSDDDRYSYSHTDSPKYAQMLFRFKVESREKTVNKIVLAFEGYGSGGGGPYPGIILRGAWNYETEAWNKSASGEAESDEVLTITITPPLSNYIDENGYVWLLAETTYGAEGGKSAVIYCDYASCTVMINGITYVDVVSYRDADRVDVKPVIFRTEFALKSWLFENVLGG